MECSSPHRQRWQWDGLAYSGVGVLWGLVFLGLVVLITVGLMRVVAEGGIYLFQLHTGPFHLAK